MSILDSVCFCGSYYGIIRYIITINTIGAFFSFNKFQNESHTINNIHLGLWASPMEFNAHYFPITICVSLCAVLAIVSIFRVWLLPLLVWDIVRFSNAALNSPHISVDDINYYSFVLYILFLLYSIAIEFGCFLTMNQEHRPVPASPPVGPSSSFTPGKPPIWSIDGNRTALVPVFIRMPEEFEFVSPIAGTPRSFHPAEATATQTRIPQPSTSADGLAAVHSFVGASAHSTGVLPFADEPPPFYSSVESLTRSQSLPRSENPPPYSPS